jgi:hypothetical protein
MRHLDLELRLRQQATTPAMRPAAPPAHELLRLQQQVGNAQVARMLRDASPTPHDGGRQGLVVQRRNGGVRRPPQPPRGPRERGRFGQLEGQRMPRTTPWRREAMERRDRQRVEAARRRFEEEVKRSQAFLERWGKEGSEPKTKAERAFRVLVKLLEFLDEVSTASNQAHESFNKVLARRLELHKQGVGTPRQFAAIDRDLVRVHQTLTALDKDLVDTLVGWHTALSDLVDNFDWKNPGNVVNTVLSMIGLLVGGLMKAGELKKRADEINQSMLPLDLQLWSISPPVGQPVGQSAPETIGEAD